MSSWVAMEGSKQVKFWVFVQDFFQEVMNVVGAKDKNWWFLLTPKTISGMYGFYQNLS